MPGNRNAEGPESLEATIRQENTDGSLPVLTIAEPVLILSDRAYAEGVAERLLGVIIDLDKLRGLGRIYQPENEPAPFLEHRPLPNPASGR
jgi:hypothetical protein